MTRQELIARLRRLHTLLTIEKRSNNLALALRRAIDFIATWKESPDEMSVKVSTRRLFAGYGPKFYRVYDEIRRTGSCWMLEELQPRHDVFFCALCEIPSIGIVMAQRMYFDRSIRTIDDLRIACSNHILEKIPAFGGQRLKAVEEWLMNPPEIDFSVKNASFESKKPGNASASSLESPPSLKKGDAQSVLACSSSPRPAREWNDNHGERNVGAGDLPLKDADVLCKEGERLSDATRRSAKIFRSVTYPIFEPFEATSLGETTLGEEAKRFENANAERQKMGFVSLDGASMTSEECAGASQRGQLNSPCADEWNDADRGHSTVSECDSNIDEAAREWDDDALNGRELKSALRIHLSPEAFHAPSDGCPSLEQSGDTVEARTCEDVKTHSPNASMSVSPERQNAMESVSRDNRSSRQWHPSQEARELEHLVNAFDTLSDEDKVRSDARAMREAPTTYQASIYSHARGDSQERSIHQDKLVSNVVQSNKIAADCIFVNVLQADHLIAREMTLIQERQWAERRDAALGAMQRPLGAVQADQIMAKEIVAHGIQTQALVCDRLYCVVCHCAQKWVGSSIVSQNSLPNESQDRDLDNSPEVEA